MIRAVLPDRLRDFRKRSGLTVNAVGEMIGKSGKTVSAWERGHGQPDADILLKLCEIYHVGSISELVGDPRPTGQLDDQEQRLLSIFKDLEPSEKEYLLKTAELVAKAHEKNPSG